MYAELNGNKIHYCIVCSNEIEDFNEHFCSDECAEFHHEFLADEKEANCEGNGDCNNCEMIDCYYSTVMDY